jgi:hypothetical protein
VFVNESAWGGSSFRFTSAIIRDFAEKWVGE